MKEKIAKFLNNMFDTNTKKKCWLVMGLLVVMVVMYIISAILWNVDLLGGLVVMSTMATAVLKFYFDKSLKENEQKYSTDIDSEKTAEEIITEVNVMVEKLKNIIE